MAKYTSWDDWFNSVTKPYLSGPQRPQKKKKPFIGPTVESARTQSRGGRTIPPRMATAKEGRINVLEPEAPMPGVSRADQMRPGSIPLAIPQTLVNEAMSPGAIIAQSNIAVTPGSSAAGLTNMERTVRDISLGYFKATGRLPSPDKVSTIMNNKATIGLSVEGYASLFRGVDSIPEAYPHAGAEVGFFQHDQSYQGVVVGGIPTEGFGIRNRPNVIHPYADDFGGNVPKSQMQNDMERIIAAKRKPATSADEAVLRADPATEMIAFSEMIAERLRNRGAPVEWDVERPWGDSDFLRNAAMYAMGQQFAYSIWGRGKDKVEANKTIDYLRTLPFSEGSWQALGRKLGVGVAEWSDQQTFGLVMDAIRSTDNDLARQAVYDAWMFGRAKGDSPSQARSDYASKFGAERLPVKDRMAFEQSNETILGMLGNVTTRASEVWEGVKEIPVLGYLAAPIGEVVLFTQKWIFAVPLQETMRSIVVLYDVGMQASSDRGGMTLNEYQAAMGRGEKFGSGWDLWNYHWGVVTDTSRWAQAYEEAGGKTPLSVLAQNISLDMNGYVAPWAKDVGDLADFSVMFYAGAKMDPFVRSLGYAGGQVAFKAGRATERYVHDTFADARAARLANEANGITYMNSFGFHIPKDEMGKVPKENLALVEELQAEATRPGVSTDRLAEIADELDTLKGPAKVEEIPGQTAMEVSGIDFDARVAALDVHVQNGPYYDRFIADSVNDAQWMMKDGRKVEAEHWLQQAEGRAESLSGTKLAPPKQELPGQTAMDAGLSGPLAASERMRVDYERLVADGMAPEKAAKKARANENKRNYDPEDAAMEREQARYDREMDSETAMETPVAAEGKPTVKPEIVRAPRPSEKPLWELTEDEAVAALKAEKAAEKVDVEGALGSVKAKEWRRLDKKARNSSDRDSNAAYEELRAFEDALPKDQYNRIYGIGEDIYGLDDLKSVVHDVYGSIDFGTEATLAHSIRKAMTDIGDATDPAKMRSVELIAWMRLKYAVEHGSEIGLDMKKTFESAIKSAASRFDTPEDVLFMLDRWRTDKVQTPEPLGIGPATTNEAGVKPTAWTKVKSDEPVTIRGYNAGRGLSGARLTAAARVKLGRDTLLGEGLYVGRTKGDVAYVGGEPAVYEVTLQKPYVLEGDLHTSRFDAANAKAIEGLDADALKAQGYDGVILKDVRYNGKLWNEAVAFDEKAARNNEAGVRKVFDDYYRFKQDNPVEKGMPDAEEWMRQNPHAITASYRNDILVDPAKLKRIPGELDEHTKMDLPSERKRVDTLAQKMVKDGWQGEGVSIRVYADGKAVIMEGNHRVRAAEKVGIRKIPIEVRYFGGGEMKTSFNPMDYLPDDSPFLRGETLPSLTPSAARGVETISPSGVKVYHGTRVGSGSFVPKGMKGSTVEEKLASIREHGLIPAKDSGGVTVSSTKDFAEGYATNSYGDPGFIVEFEIPRSRVSEYLENPPEIGSMPAEVRLKKSIPPEYIKSVEMRGVQDTLPSRGVASPIKSAPVTTNEAGVKVAEVQIPETSARGKQFVETHPVEVDASIAEPIQRLNDGGYKTHQSHSGSKADHPAGHDALKAEPYVEFAYADLKVGGSVKTKAGLIRAAAARAGATTESGTKPSTLIVHGDVAKFTDELLGPQAMGEAPPVGPPIGPVGTETVAGSVARWQNVIFRTVAEVLAKVDSPRYIGWLHEVPEDNLPAMKLVHQIAEAKTVEEVMPLLRQLEQHGIDIDGGASAFYKNMRQRAYRNGFGRRNLLRYFITPITYGKTHPIEGSTDMMFDVMVATKMGMKRLDEKGYARARELADEMFAESRPLKKRNVADKIWEEIEANIISREGSLDGLTKFEHTYHRAQGRAMMAGSRRAYFAKFDENGVPIEISRATSTGKARGAVQHDLDRAEAELKGLTEDASAKTKTKLEERVAEAKAEVIKISDAIDDFNRFSVKKRLSKAQDVRLKKAIAMLDKYDGPVPFKMGQAAAHIVHKHNPRIVSAYMSGPAGRGLAITDQAVFQPLMTIFKETVMSAMGFPIRVNIGDEYIRLIPEGTIRRMKDARATKAEMMEKGLWTDELEAEIKDVMAYDWVASDSGDWILVTKQTHPRYFEYLHQDLNSWKREPIVQRLLERNGGEFPEDVGDIRTFIREISEEDSELGQELRDFLDDTYRYEGNTIDNANFEEWTSLWQERMEVIASEDVYRRSMTETITPDDLKNLPDEKLWPVNAPEELKIGASRNKLYQLSRANPFHYIYHGVNVPFKGEFALGGKHVPGSIQLLGVMSNWLRETMFADRYYLERKAILARTPELANTEKGLLEIHKDAAAAAMKYTNKTTYSRSSTMFEDMTRNLVPFGNAYRQFWQYWMGAFAKHPVALSVFLEGAGEARQDIAGVVGGVSEAAGGPPIELNDNFLTIGNYRAYLPSVPFLATTDEGVSPEGPADIAKSNIPMAGFILTTGARTLLGAAGASDEDFQTLSKLPGMAGMYGMSPFSRQSQLLYGVTGWIGPGEQGWGGNTTLESLFGDPKKLQKAHVNAVLAQLHYDKDGTGDGEVKRDKPWWWQASESVLGLVGMHDVKPEALFAEGMKEVPIPMSFKYVPKEVRDKDNWLYEYYQALDTGDEVTAAGMRGQHKWLDDYLSYYDASYEEQLKMKRDPANAEMLKYWISPYNYGKDGSPLDGRDWQIQFTEGKVNYKTEDQLIASVHNLYTDIHGGTYIQSDTRQVGTQYAGDNPRETAEKRTKAKLTTALAWAKKVAARGAKERGWDPVRLMWNFQNPDKNFGIWPEIIKAYGLDPMEYNVSAIAKTFADKYGKDYKLKAQYLSSTDALRALDMARWLPDPKIADRLLTETPYVDDVRKAKKEQRDDITKKIIESAGSEQWYDIGSQQLNTVGIKASPKLDLIQLDLNVDYQALQKLKARSKEYTAARTAYYAKRDRLLKGVKGGAAIAGGVADRIIALGFVLTPNVTTMGTGRGALPKQQGFDHFQTAVKTELKKDDPNPEHLNKAWDKFVGYRTYAPKQQKELLRVAAWSYLLAEAKHLRHDMRTHYSDYYKAPGESSSSKYGMARVQELNRVARQLRTFSPEFGVQLDTWFGKKASIGTRFLDWYSY